MKAHVEMTRKGPPTPWLGQLVPVDVDVWRPRGAVSLEPFSLDDVVAAGMIVKWSAQAPPPDEKYEGGAPFLVQHRTLLVFPESEGELTIPPVTARWTDPTTHLPVLAESAPLHFHAALPQGTGDSLPLIAGSVALEQRFDRDVSRLRVGDGFTRTLTLHASDTNPIVFPEIELGTVSGMTAYAAAPQAESSTERGEFRAAQTLRVTYVVNRVGPHQIGGISLRWLEPRSGHYSVAAVPERTIWARPNPALGFQCLGTARGAALGTGLGSLVTLALVAFAVLRRARRGPGRWERRLEQRGRERRAFHELREAARRSPALLVLQKSYDWLAVRFPGGLDRTLAPLKGVSTEARDAFVRLETDTFRNGKTTPPGPPFVSMLRRMREAMGRARRAIPLASLNPARTTEQGGPR